MSGSLRRRTGQFLAMVLVAAGVALVGSEASAATVSINLCAVSGTVKPLPATSPGTSFPIWGFVLRGAAADCSDVQGTATLPGPLLSVAKGDAVTISVRNELPAGHPLTFEVPGLSFAPGPNEAAVHATVTRTFTANAPGTYLYQSGGSAGRQVAMGLAGALLVRSATAGQAYDATTTAYDVEAPLVLSALDPAFNAAPDTFNLHDYRATYWLINGRSYPDTTPIAAATGGRVLLRFLNAGYDNTSMSAVGLHARVLARDARLLTNPIDAATETIPAGATEDAVATVPASAPPSANGFPLFNRQLHLTNGTLTGPTATTGGMLTFLKVAP